MPLWRIPLNGITVIPKLLRLGLHWGKLFDGFDVRVFVIPKLLRLGLHWGVQEVAEHVDELREFLSFYA